MKTPHITELSVAESQAYAFLYPLAYANRCDDAVTISSPSFDRTYTCTRHANHPGLHVAHAPMGPVAAWRYSE